MAQKKIVVRKIIYTGIVIFWVVTMALLVSKHYGPHKKPDGAVSGGSVPESLYGEQWMGVYYRNEKIGYSLRTFEKTEGGYKMSETLKAGVTMFGARKQIGLLTSANLDRDLRLYSFDLSFSSDADLHVSGRVDGKSLRLTFTLGDQATEQVIPLDDAPSLGLSWLPGILGEGIKTGRKFSLTMFDPATLSRGEVRLEVGYKEHIQSMGGSVEAFKIRATLKGMDFYVWITEKGDIVREESPMGFTLIKERREDAVKTGGPSADVIEQVSVPFEGKLAEDAHYLRVRISGIDFKGLEIDGGRQILKGDLLEIRRETLAPHGGAGKQSGEPHVKIPDEYLENTLFIQSKDPRIVSLSREITGGAKDKVTIAKRISEWVYKNIEKTPSFTVPVSTEVLKTRRGDCNEHTTLFTALSRAAGIPARMALGLTLKERRFYYHAWPEIFIGEWVAVDPTLGQFPADASHIRLITGGIDTQMRILSAIGKIKIEVLDYR